MKERKQDDSESVPTHQVLKLWCMIKTGSTEHWNTWTVLLKNIPKTLMLSYIKNFVLINSYKFACGKKKIKEKNKNNFKNYMPVGSFSSVRYVRQITFFYNKVLLLFLNL